MTELINDGGVCSTVSATPGLLISSNYFYKQSVGIFSTQLDAV